jgi:hypothetical protein
MAQEVKGRLQVRQGGLPRLEGWDVKVSVISQGFIEGGPQDIHVGDVLEQHALSDNPLRAES